MAVGYIGVHTIMPDLSLFEQDIAKLIVQTLKLKVDPATIQPEAALFGDGLGLDSIDALELSLAISQTYRLSTQVERSGDHIDLFLAAGAGQSNREKPHEVTACGAMHDTPLIGPYNPEDVLAWEQGGPRTARQFLADCPALAESLPDRPAVLNLATSRYEFLVGFAAAILRRQLTLLPQSRAPQNLRRIADDYPDSYCLTDRDETIDRDPVDLDPTTGRTGFPGPGRFLVSR